VRGQKNSLAFLCANGSATANTSSLAFVDCLMIGGDNRYNTPPQDFNTNKIIDEHYIKIL